jgi:hypothetical protein
MLMLSEEAMNYCFQIIKGQTDRDYTQPAASGGGAHALVPYKCVIKGISLL